MQKYMSLRQVAEEQNLKPVTLRKYIKQGKLKAFKSGNKYYINILLTLLYLYRLFCLYTI